MSNLVCTKSRVPIVLAGILFLGIFIVNIALAAYYWNHQNNRESESSRFSVTRSWLPYAFVLMVGVLITALYVMYYIRCDVTAAIVTLLLPLLGAIAVAAKWPCYSLNPLVFGYQVAVSETINK